MIQRGPRCEGVEAKKDGRFPTEAKGCVLSQVTSGFPLESAQLSEGAAGPQVLMQMDMPPWSEFVFLEVMN